MTTSTPQLSVRLTFDSVRDRHTDFLLVKGGEPVPGNNIQDAHQVLEPEIGKASISPKTMDLKINTALDGAPAAPVSTKDVPGCSAMKETKNTADTSSAKKNIRFLLDDKKNIVEDIFEYEAMPRDEQQYSDEDLDEMLTNAMLVARHFTRHRKDWQNKIKFLLKGCSARDLKTEKPTPLKGEDLDFVVDCEARGLELYIHPMFQKSREKAIRSVIKVQKDYNASEEIKGKKDPEMRVKVLRGQSMKYTQPARLLAKTLANGDTRAAAKANKEVEALQEGGDPNTDNATTEVGEITKRQEGTPGLRGDGLNALRRQHTNNVEQSDRPGAGGIGTLQATLIDETRENVSGEL